MLSYFHNTCQLIQHIEICIFYIIVLYTHYIVFLYKLTNKTCVYMCAFFLLIIVHRPNALCVSKYINNLSVTKIDPFILPLNLSYRVKGLN